MIELNRPISRRKRLFPRRDTNYARLLVYCNLKLTCLSPRPFSFLLPRSPSNLHAYRLPQTLVIGNGVHGGAARRFSS